MYMNYGGRAVQSSFLWTLRTLPNLAEEGNLKKARVRNTNPPWEMEPVPKPLALHNNSNIQRYILRRVPRSMCRSRLPQLVIIVQHITKPFVAMPSLQFPPTILCYDVTCTCTL
eukprot:scpid99815/ scgid13926/ 